MSTDLLPPPMAGEPDEISLLDWLRQAADQTVPDDFQAAAVPVAWIGRTSTDDMQDPTLSLPRQLEYSRSRLPAGFVIVAKFYDVESGRNLMHLRGRGDAHEHLNIPIVRDGSIADCLEEAKRPDRRFVAVVVENIERIARVVYFSTKIEYELEQAGVPLFAADEGIDPSEVHNLTNGSAPGRKATPTLTRRVKQAIAEWYALNMKELAWGGFKEHTNQGFNVGKPPYGYVADRIKHPVKAKANDGRFKHRLVPDKVRGQTVTQIFLWRALDRLSYNNVADRLNLDPDRYPPPDPIPGEGRRRIGAWTGGSVREVLDNPKHTGYMVWNRRKKRRKNRGVNGRVNPPTAWVWSSRPTHEPLVTREIFEAASTVGRFRKGSRSAAGTSTHPSAARTYTLRSYLRCDLCNHRTYGSTKKAYVYYRCTPNARNHAHMPWYPNHPRYVLVREDQLMEPLANFFDLRVFGASRKILLGAAAEEQVADNTIATRKALLTAEITDLQQVQSNLITELGKFTPTGDPDFDDAWRSGIQSQFASVVARQRSKKALLADLVREEQASAPADLGLLDWLPQGHIDLSSLPDDQQRRIYDAFHLELRYNALTREVSIRVSITGETAPVLAATIESILGESSKADAPVSEAEASDTGASRQRVVRQIPEGEVVADALRAPGTSRTCAPLRRFRASRPPHAV
jgi:site-specific DNA recombinase